MFNSKATTESAMKGFIVMYVRLRNALKEAGRRVRSGMAAFALQDRLQALLM